jgi:hypothetical protein
MRAGRKPEEIVRATNFKKAVTSSCRKKTLPYSSGKYQNH